MSQPGTRRQLDARPLQKLLKQYLSEGQADQRSDLMQAGFSCSFFSVSGDGSAGLSSEQSSRMAALRFPSSSMADIACATRADGDLFWRVRSGVQSH